MIPALILSVIGFGGFVALDIPALRRRAPARFLLAAGATAALAAAFLITLPLGAPLPIPHGLRIPGLAATLAGGLLLAYSILLEIPIKSRRLGPGARRTASEDVAPLITTGTYALCRHPGFIWLMIHLAGLTLVFSRTHVLGLAMLWVGLDLYVIFIQDRLIFPRAFKAYRRYQRTTPFVVPTRASVSAALHTLIENPNESLPTKNG